MENSILNLLPFDPAYLIAGLAGLVVVLLILVLVALGKIRKMNRRYEFFMEGKNARSLETLIKDQVEMIRTLKAEDRANKDMMRNLNRNSRASLQKVGVVKYNAFQGMGGNLSSAIALLDHTNTGFILNCVHSREGCYIYVKMVDMGRTDIVLGSEEQEALEQAMGYVKRKADF